MDKQYTMEELYQGFKVEAGKYFVSVRREPPLRLLTSVCEDIHPDRNMTMRILKPRNQGKSHVLDSGPWRVYGNPDDFPCGEIELGKSESCVLNVL